jgi:uncharacterized protein
MPTIKDIKISKPTQEQSHTAADWPIWSKGVCEFPWQYTETEKCLIIEGEATIYSEDRLDHISFAAGDYVVFPRGLSCIWKIEEPVRKFYDFE